MASDGEKQNLLSSVDRVAAMMISVATGGARIEEVNSQFQNLYDELDQSLSAQGLTNPFPYRDLWEWYGHWSRDLPTWASRRTFVSQIASPLALAIKRGAVSVSEPTGWNRVDRALGEARKRLTESTNEEQYQAIGLLCREVLISLAQAVFNPEHHPIEDGTAVSQTDFKRMIEAYIAVVLQGGSSKETRAHARSALDLALRLQHQRTAAFRDAAICLEATGSVVGIIAILEGKRDP